MKSFFDKAVAKIKKDVVENKEDLKENLKTAGYIAGGVAAISIAPVAAVGIVGGLAVKHFVDKKKAQDDATDAEAEQQKAEISLKFEEAKKQFIELYSAFNDNCNDDDVRENMLFALAAIATATAGYDGHISDDEKSKLATIIQSAQNSNMAQSRKNRINDFLNHPPKLQEAIESINAIPGCDKNIFRNLIIMISCCDGEYSEEERAVLTTWDTLNA